jgi:predicted dehydrogenase
MRYHRRMIHRRQFLKTAAAAGAAVNLDHRVFGANERPTLALIGGRNRGRQIAIPAIQAGAEIKTFCDLDDGILRKVGAEIAEAQGRPPEFVHEFDRVLEDKSIDGVMIATPDHWHARMALLAIQAGKDVYVEKPLCQTIREGQRIRDAARKYNRVVQVGTQRRSGEAFRSAAEYVASGGLGKVCEVKAWIYQVRESIGNPPDSDAPPGINYDAWLGPAPKRPFNRNRFHYNWRFFWDYGNTELGNQGVHMLDVALWGIQLMKKKTNVYPKRVSATGGIYWLDDAKEVPDTQAVAYDYGDLMLHFELRSFAFDHQLHQGQGRKASAGGADFYTAFYGTEGTLMSGNSGWKVYRRDGSVEPQVKATPETHEQNWIDCIKSRARPNSDVEIGRLSTMLCHLGNISYKLGRDVHFNGENEDFGDDREANALLVKTYRSPYDLPEV